MPHATNDDAMGDIDEDAAIRSYLQGNGGYGMDPGFEEEFDQGDKDEDAIDYGDLSDDDLPEEEEASNRVNGEEDDANFFHQMSSALGGEHGPQSQTNGFHDEHDAKPHLNGDANGEHLPESSDLYDLFGERSSSPEQHRKPSVDHSQSAPMRPGLALPGKSSLALPGARTGGFQPQFSQARQQQSSLASSPPLSARDGFSPGASGHEDGSEYEAEDEAMDDPLYATQALLFNNAKRRQNGELVEEATEVVDMHKFYSIFPEFNPNQNPDFIDLFPPRTVQYRRKAPLKPPKPVVPTKVSLDLLPDTERLFKTSKAAEPLQRDGLVFFASNNDKQEESDDDLALSDFDENERIGGITAQDLILLCENWDILSLGNDSVATPRDGYLDGNWESEEHSRPRKKARTDILNTDLSMSLQAPELSFEDPERATARLAKSVALDMNDPNLLIDEIEPQKRRVKRSGGDAKRDSAMSKDLARRYNISNDEAYDLLKENHQHKVRSTIGSNATEHSLPAARLQYPFYKVHLDSKQKRAFHRPPLDMREPVRKELRFTRPKHTKRKHIKGKKIQELFAKAEDLSVGDNSNLLLLEYSEEAPLMMSNFGMGNRLVNYYRKKNADDNERPKRDIGETQVLLPQDKSPFANFGHVDSGEVVPTVQNAMYRAPVFAHKTKQTDFLVGVSSTYASGSRLFVRNVENLHTVGQQFPVAEVPTEHSRKVTNAAKHRLRTLAYRILRKSQNPVPGQKRKALTNENLMPHLPGHDMPQLRSKMREFMKYERSAGKDGYGVWTTLPGQQVPDEETLRGWITPTDICLLDSMQVGVQHLADLGYSSRGKDLEKEDEDIDEGANIEIQLAPWHATRTFIAATQSKAMLALHGEGDPTGRGEAFSFVKTSMKGGFQAAGESAQDKIQAKKRRETGGHSYNVAQQQRAYDDSIRRIWEKQKESLSNDVEMSDVEPDHEHEPPQSAYPTGRAATPRSSFGTPAAFSKYDDESASQFSRGSANRGDKVLTIARQTKDKWGKDVTEYEKVTNPRVIQLYRKRKMEKELLHESFLEYTPSGDAELDALKKQQIEKELERIKRNADRRTAREKQKGRVAVSADPGTTVSAASPGGPSDADGSAADGTPQKGAGGRGRNKDGTARKCANCGQVGHIKTNRKLCPLLNGTMKADDANGGGDSSFGAAPAPLIL